MRVKWLVNVWIKFIYLIDSNPIRSRFVKTKRQRIFNGIFFTNLPYMQRCKLNHFVGWILINLFVNLMKFFFSQNTLKFKWNCWYTFIVNSLVTGLWSLIMNCGWLRYDVCSVTSSMFLKAASGVLYSIRSHHAGRRLKKKGFYFLFSKIIIQKSIFFLMELTHFMS